MAVGGSGSTGPPDWELVGLTELGSVGEDPWLAQSATVPSGPCPQNNCEKGVAVLAAHGAWERDVRRVARVDR